MDFQRALSSDSGVACRSALPNYTYNKNRNDMGDFAGPGRELGLRTELTGVFGIRAIRGLGRGGGARKPPRNSLSRRCAKRIPLLSTGDPGFTRHEVRRLYRPESGKRGEGYALPARRFEA